MKNLPYFVSAYGATAAAFNSLKDALDYAQAQSAVLRAGRWTVHDSNHRDEMGQPLTYGIFLCGEEK